MSDLSTDRIQTAPLFQITGIDYAGPFFIKDRKSRCKISKCYISLFRVLCNKGHTP